VITEQAQFTMLAFTSIKIADVFPRRNNESYFLVRHSKTRAAIFAVVSNLSAGMKQVDVSRLATFGTFGAYRSHVALAII
jgi:hypothetical protein